MIRDAVTPPFVPMAVRDAFRAYGATHLAISRDAPVLVYYGWIGADGAFRDVGNSYGDNQCRRQHSAPRKWAPEIQAEYKLEPLA